MKILHVLEATGGGTRRHILDLLPALVRRGISCDLVASPRRDPYFARDKDYLEARGVCVYPLRMTRGFAPRDDVQALRALHQHLKSHHYDLVHCHSTKAGLLGRLARLAHPSTRIVYTPHCIAFDTGLSRRQRRAARWMEALLARLTTHAIAVSQREQKALCRIGHKNVSLIHNGVDLKAFDALPRANRNQFGLEDSDYVIGCFGRLTRQKNQAVLVRALPRVLESVSNAKLFFVGDGEDGLCLRQLATRLNIADKIVWPGDVEDARPLYELCNLVIQPSRWEGCPYTVLEAMAAQCLVIARDVGAVGEILNEKCGVAYHVSTRNEAQFLSQQIIEFAQNQCAENARQRVEESFTLEQMVEKTIKVYVGIL
jgi:glycosyltransferase involved in cell wall biosynthesis